MDHSADDAALALVRSGDRDAFRVLVSRYQDRIYSTILNYVRNPDDALDIAQETFVKAFARLGSYHGGSAFYTWLYRIAVNASIDFLRKRPQRALESLEDSKFADVGYEPATTNPETSPEAMLGRSEMRRSLACAIDSLSEKLRTAVILHDVEGLSQEEIAAVLGCPVGTVKSRVSRARQELRAVLADQLEAEVAP